MAFSSRLSILVILSLYVTNVLSHMQMSEPCPLRSPLCSKPNGPVDYNYLTPLKTDGSDFTCKGYQWNTPLDPVETYYAGETYNMSIKGGATHGGGSCQLALSYDNGETFKVIKSMIGGCPMTSTYYFTIPEDAPSGDALFGWTWFNRIGNREMYMNCAAVTIINSRDGSSGSSSRSANKVISRWPDLWVANLKGINTCTTQELTDAIFPDPGEDVVYGNDDVRSAWTNRRTSILACKGVGRRAAGGSAVSTGSSSSWSSTGSGADSSQFSAGTGGQGTDEIDDGQWHSMGTGAESKYASGQTSKTSWSQESDAGQWRANGPKAGPIDFGGTGATSSEAYGQPQAQTWSQVSSSSGQTESSGGQSSPPNDGQWRPNGQKAKPDDGQWHPDGQQTRPDDGQWHPGNTETRPSFSGSGGLNPASESSSNQGSSSDISASSFGAMRQDSDAPPTPENPEESITSESANPLGTEVNWEEIQEPTEYDITDYLPDPTDIPGILDDKGGFPDLTQPLDLGDKDILISDDSDYQRARLTTPSAPIPDCRNQDTGPFYVRPSEEWFAEHTAPSARLKVKRNKRDIVPSKYKQQVWNCEGCNSPNRCIKIDACTRTCTRLPYRTPIAISQFDTEEGYPSRVLPDTDEGYPGPVPYDTPEGYPSRVSFDTEEGYPHRIGPDSEEGYPGPIGFDTEEEYPKPGVRWKYRPGLLKKPVARPVVLPRVMATGACVDLNAPIVARPIDLSRIPPTGTFVAPPFTTVATSACPTSPIPYATGDPSAFLPCQLGTYLCKSVNEYYTCGQFGADGSWTYGALQEVSSGMKCEPNLVPDASKTQSISSVSGTSNGERFKEAATSASPNPPSEALYKGTEAVSRPTESASSTRGLDPDVKANALAAIAPYILAPGPVIPSDSSVFPADKPEKKKGSATYYDALKKFLSKAASKVHPNILRNVEREACPVVPEGYYRSDLYVAK